MLPSIPRWLHKADGPAMPPQPVWQSLDAPDVDGVRGKLHGFIRLPGCVDQDNPRPFSPVLLAIPPTTLLPLGCPSLACQWRSLVLQKVQPSAPSEHCIELMVHIRYPFARTSTGECQRTPHITQSEPVICLLCEPLYARLRHFVMLPSIFGHPPSYMLSTGRRESLKRILMHPQELPRSPFRLSPPAKLMMSRQLLSREQPSGSRQVNCKPKEPPIRLETKESRHSYISPNPAPHQHQTNCPRCRTPGACCLRDTAILRAAHP